jgi:hypothetical protein
MILKLEASVPDAKKIDKGKVGEPGIRLRRVAQEMKGDMDVLRKEVLALRD